MCNTLVTDLQQARCHLAPQGRLADPACKPHVYQHAHYLPSSLHVTESQAQRLKCTMTPDDQMMIEVVAAKATLEKPSCSSSGSTQQLQSTAVSVAGGDNNQQSVPSSTPPSRSNGNDDNSLPDSESILPYHVSMLNDQQRTLCYRDGIHGAVRELSQKFKTGTSTGFDEASSEQIVLDIGSGTGLLSLMACQAGAPRVIGKAPLLAF